jgi:dipeptidyl aminopeptidase/acylaminoacyl peptidase
VDLKGLNLELASTASSPPGTFKIGFTIWGDDPVVYAYPLDVSNELRRADWFLLDNNDAINLTSQLEQVPKSAPEVIGNVARFRTQTGVYSVDRFGDRLKLSSSADTASAATAEFGSRSILAVSDAGKVKAVNMHTPAGGILLTRNEDGSARQVWTYNEHLALTRPPRHVLIRYKSATGQDLNSWLILPPGHKDGDRHPTLVFGYPWLKMYDDWSASNPGFLDPWDATFLNALPYVEKGYAFLLVDADITPFGRRADRLSEIPGVVLPAIDRAIDEGYVDPDKLGLYGASQNGYVQTSLLCQTERFKAAVSIGSTLQNLVSAYGVIGRKNDGLQENPGAIYYGQPEGMLLAAPWQDPEGYARNSPLMCADKINTPILLMRGDLDSWSGGQSEEIFVALYRMNKDAELVTYWGEGHDLRSPANIRDFNRRVLEWYERYMPTG